MQRSGSVMTKLAQLGDASPTSTINLPDITVNAREVFGVDIDMQVPAVST
jgi:cobaltochelatase CobS